MLDASREVELRGHKRLKTRKAARLAIDDVWRGCFILNVSGSGARLEIEQPATVGQAVVLIDDDLGMIAATVCRQEAGSVSIEFGVSEADKQDLAEKLAGVLSAHFLS